MKLRTIEYGTPGQGVPIFIVHGLFGSARNWGAIAKRMADTRHVVSVDMRNHGESPRSETNSYADMAQDLADTLPGQADIIGHSMGGKAAMVLALARPDLVNRLLVADISPVGYGHSQSHLIEAMRAIDLDEVRTRGDADRQLAPLVEDPGVRAFLLQSLDVKEKRWRLNHDVLEAEMAKIIGFPDVSGGFDGPALFLAGGDSDYVQPAHRPAIKSLFPNARFAKIPGAGHWLHAEKPREFEATAQVFFGG